MPESAGTAARGFYNGWMLRVPLTPFAVVVAVVAAVALAGPAHGAQTPQPFPRPGAAQPQAPPTVAAPPVAPAPPRAAAPAPPPAPAPATPVPPADANGAPTAAALGFPVYPAAEYITSYDAGRGQRYYIFGTTAPYAELVTYYRAQLKDKGDEVFAQPPTYMFSIGRFREETMAFPPGVTIKDFTWGGSPGYPNPSPKATQARFPTIIMIVPLPPAAPVR
jgi:hypothetical protein